MSVINNVFNARVSSRGCLWLRLLQAKRVEEKLEQMERKLAAYYLLNLVYCSLYVSSHKTLEYVDQFGFKNRKFSLFSGLTSKLALPYLS